MLNGETLVINYEKSNFEQGSKKMAWAGSGGSTCPVIVSDTHWLLAALAQLGLRTPDGLGQAGGWSFLKRRTKVTARGLGRLRGAHKAPLTASAWVPVCSFPGQQGQGWKPKEPFHCSATSSPGHFSRSQPHHGLSQLKTLMAPITSNYPKSSWPSCPL